jgi:hypothetical protein
MVYRKGELTKKRTLRDWPHDVLAAIPEGGLGTLLNDMREFCRGRDYRTASQRQTSGTDAVIWCFRSAEDATAFARHFNVELVSR